MKSRLDTRARRENFLKKIKKNHRWTIRDYRPGDEQKMAPLAKEVYGLDVDLEDWKWLYQKSPHGPARVFVAEEIKTGRLVGWHAGLPRLFRIGHKRELIDYVFDTMVVSEYQKRGMYAVLFLQLVSVAPEQGAITYLGLPNNLAISSVQKMGGDKFVTLTAYARVWNSRNLLAKWARPKFLAALLTPLTNLLFTKPLRANAASEAEAATEIHEFTTDVDRLCDAALPADAVAVTRDARYLNWRYFEHPKKIYTVFKTGRGQTWDGYIAVRILEKWGLRIGMIVDIATDPKNPSAGPALLARAARYFTEQNADLTVALMCGPERYAAFLKKGGYWSSKLLWTKRPFHLCVGGDTLKDVDRLKNETYFDLMSQGEKWFLTLGDTDIA